jgi:hypothetical protein
MAVDGRMAFGANCYQVLLGVLAQVTTKLFVVNFQA